MTNLDLASQRSGGSQVHDLSPVAGTQYRTVDEFAELARRAARLSDIVRSNRLAAERLYRLESQVFQIADALGVRLSFD